MIFLLTGASGFLGKIITATLEETEILTLGRFNANIITDLCKEIPDIPVVDSVIHAAGKAHSLPFSKSEIHEFYNTNVTGTFNLLKGLEKNAKLPSSFIFISSVAVYGLKKGVLISEDYALDANDPYGESKIQAEKLVQAWCAKNFVCCSILRLPLIAGPNPPGNLKSMITGINKGYYFNVVNGAAKKSVVMAEDVARIIPIVAGIGGVFNLTDGHHPSFYELSLLISKQLNKKNPASLPLTVARLLGIIGDLFGRRAPFNSAKLKKILSELTFDDTRARKAIGWQPQKVIDAFYIK